MTDEFWNWRFHNNFGEPIRYLMWENDMLIGHYVAHPLPFKVNENEEKVLFSMSVMTHPDYRGRGVFQELAKQVYHEAQQVGYRFAIGFPNMNSYKIHFEKLGWTNLGRIVEFERTIGSTDALLRSDTTTYKIEELSRFDDTIDQLWHHVKHKYSFLFTRDQAFLNWRYTEHPLSSFVNYPNFLYHKYAVQSGNQIVAYFVLKDFGSQKGHIVDFFGDVTKEIMRAIISFAIKFCQSNNLPILSFWIGQDKSDQIKEVLRSFTFVPKVSDTHFGIRSLNGDIHKSMLDASKWLVRMGDSDVY